MMIERRSRRRVSPYLLLFFLPVLVVILVAGAIVYSSVQSIRQEYQASVQAQTQDYDKLSAARRFNQDVGAVQILVGDTLVQAAAGEIGADQVYRVHTSVVNALAALEPRLLELENSLAGAGETPQAREDFEVYRNLIISATDMAAIDPRGAMQQAFLAGQRYVAFSEHARSIATATATAMAGRAQAQVASFETQVFKLSGTGTALLVMLLLVWMTLARRMLKRAVLLSDAMRFMVASDVVPASMPQVERISRDASGVLSDTATALMAFRDSVQARKAAQSDLSKRMKELSCLYDVSRLAQRDDLSEPALLQQVLERLPQAMRYPEQVVAAVQMGADGLGDANAARQLHVLSVELGVFDQQFSF